MKKFTLKHVLAILMTVALLTACGGNGGQEQAPAEDEQANVQVDVEPDAGSDVDPPAAGDGEVFVGYAVMGMVDAFWLNHIAGMEAAIAESGRDIRFETADNAHDAQLALENAQSFIDRGIDLLVIGSSDEAISGAIMEYADAAGVPVVTVGLPLPGAHFMTFDDYNAGEIAGEWAAEYFLTNFPGVAPRIVTIGAFSMPSISEPRLNGFTDVVQARIPEAELVISVNSEGQREMGANAMADVLTAHPDVNMVFGVNDDCIFGAVSSIEARGMGMDDTIRAFGLGGISEEAFIALLDPDSIFVGTVAFNPFEYGRATVNELVLPLLDGELPPERLEAPLALATVENAAEYLED